MKRKAILKVMLVIAIGTVLLATSRVVLAATSDTTDLDDFLNSNINFENQGSKNDLMENTNTNTNRNNNQTTDSTSNTNKNTNTNRNIPKAGLAENTMAGVAITVLGITAVYAYKKINEYKNI